MDQISIEELHHIPLEINSIPEKSSLLAACPNGLIFVARKNDLVVYSAEDYQMTSSSFAQRMDKPLSDFQPNVSIPMPRRISWISCNCSGGLLLIAAENTLQLLNIQNLSPKAPFGLLGDPTELPSADGVIRDIAWNPADRNRFAVVMTTGAVRMFTVNQLQTPPINCAAYLPAKVQACCLSWSPKGKQLALAVVNEAGALSGPEGASVVQVDHDLKVKRLIPLAGLLAQQLKDVQQPQPTDLLWTSSYCFLLAVRDSSQQAKAVKLAFIAAPQKGETRVTHLEEYTSFADATTTHYMMRLVPNSGSLVTVTWSGDAEELYLLDVPVVSNAPTSTETPIPRLIKSLPLPTDASPVATDIGALTNSPDPLPLMLGLLANGALFGFKIVKPANDATGLASNIFAGFRMWCGAADKAPQLPPRPEAVEAKNEAPSVAESKAPSVPSAFGTLFGSSPASNPQPAPVGTNASNVSFGSSSTSSQPPANVVVSSTPVPTKSPVVSVQKPSTPEKVTEPGATVQPKPSPQVSQAILAAAEKFSKCLKTQAENTAKAWNNLYAVYEGTSENLQLKDGDGAGAGKSVWDIEQSLQNMEQFLGVVDEITNQLAKASQLSVYEQTRSADYLERLSADFDDSKNQRGGSTMSAGLDPEAAALLGALRRKSRAAETFLADLEDQVESLSSQLEARSERANRLSGRNRSGVALSDMGSTPLDKIQATMAANAHLIKCERSRLELISRFTGISLGDQPEGTKAPLSSLGGSSISLDREQRDARVYQALCSSTTTTTTAKKTPPSADGRIPVARAASNVKQVLELLAKAAGETKDTPKSTPKAVAVKTTKSVGCATPPISSPAQQKNLEISKLLDSAASVPPVILATGVPSPLGPRNTSPIRSPTKSDVASNETSTKPTPPTSTPTTVADSLTPAASTSKTSTPLLSMKSSPKPSLFTPSSTMSLTPPTRATTTVAPTTKVFGATGDDFKPLSPKVPSPTEKQSTPVPASISAPSPATTTTTTASAATKPPTVTMATTAAAGTSPSPFGALFKSASPAATSSGETAAPTLASLISPQQPAATTSSLSDTTDKSASGVSTTAPSVPGAFANLFGKPPPTAAAAVSVATTTTAATVATTAAASAVPAKNLFGLPSTTATETKPTPSLFGGTVTTTALDGAASFPKPTFPFGTTQSNQPATLSFGSLSISGSPKPSPLFGTSTVASSTPSTTTTTTVPTIFGSSPTLTVSTASTTGSTIFGLSPATTASSPAPTTATTGFTIIGSSPSTAVPSATTTAGPTIFGASPVVTSSSAAAATTTTTASIIFGQSTVTTTAAAGTAPNSGNLFGQVATSNTAPSGGGLFGSFFSAPPAAGGGPFGMASPSGGLFSQLQQQQQQQQQQQPTGQSPGSSNSGGLFGNTTSLFGGSNVSNSTATTTTTNSGIPSVSNVSNLFAMSNFGLGGTGAPATGDGGLFRKTLTPAATATATTTSAPFPARNLFGGGGGASTANSGGGGGSLFGFPTLNPPQPTAAAATQSSTTGGGFFSSSTGTFNTGLFGNATGGGLFGSASTPSTAASSSSLFAAPTQFGAPAGGLFSGGGGLFGSLTAPTTAAAPGFGAPPVFGAPALPAQPVSSTSAAVGSYGGLFASLGSAPGSASFGGLANATAQPAQNLPFNSSPSFTQRRA